MKILLVSSYLPYPLNSGGHVRLYNLIKMLSQKHEITLVCEIRDFQTNEDIKEIEKLCKKVITVKRKKQWSASNIFKSIFSSSSFLVTGHSSSVFKEKISDEINQNKFDLIHVETFYVMQNIINTSIPIVLTEHNIEYLVYKRYADKAPLILRPFLYIDILKIFKNEKKAWKKANKIVVVSEEDKRYINLDNVHVVPNGVDINKFIFKKPIVKKYHSNARHQSLPEKEILFIGDFKWIQNRNSAKWIINDIWPYLLRALDREVKIRLNIVGKNIPDNIRKLSTYDSINFDENAPENTQEIFQKSDLLLAPIQVGGGTSFKILEAMASGVPVVTTDLGVKGLDINGENEVLFGKNTQEIVDKTARLLRDNELYEKIAGNARRLIEEKYSWDSIIARLENVYMAI